MNGLPEKQTMMPDSSIYGELNAMPRWYALHTKFKHEKRVHQRLADKGIETYLPLNTSYRKWSDRYKTIQEPLFSCYVFVNIALRDRLPVLQTDGAVALVSFNGIPAPIPDSQLDSIRMVLERNPTVYHEDYFTPGKRVSVKRGPLKGLEGTLIENKNQAKLKISIDGIQQAFSVEIDIRDLELL